MAENETLAAAPAHRNEEQGITRTDMSEAADIRAPRTALHAMMGIAFVEIRAAETMSRTKKIADIFHNLPTALLNCIEKEHYEAVFRNLLDRAARHGMQDYIQELHRTAMK